MAQADPMEVFKDLERSNRLVARMMQLCPFVLIETQPVRSCTLCIYCLHADIHLQTNMNSIVIYQLDEYYEMIDPYFNRLAYSTCSRSPAFHTHQERDEEQLHAVWQKLTMRANPMVRCLTFIFIHTLCGE